MSFYDDCYEDLLMEHYYHSEAINNYTAGMSDKDLMKEASGVLASISASRMNPNERNKIISIIQKGIFYQNLTERQRFALGDFILDWR